MSSNYNDDYSLTLDNGELEILTEGQIRTFRIEPGREYPSKVYVRDSLGKIRAIASLAQTNRKDSSYIEYIINTLVDHTPLTEEEISSLYNQGS